MPAKKKKDTSKVKTIKPNDSKVKTTKKSKSGRVSTKSLAKPKDNKVKTKKSNPQESPVIDTETLYAIGEAQLNSYQTKILEECYVLGSGTMSLPMGSGKTLLGLIVGLKSIITNPESCGMILVICAKSLLPSWITEIHKFFGDNLTYTIFHGDAKKQGIIPEGCKVVLTTPATLAKIYSEYNLEFKYVREEQDITPPFTITKYYNRPRKPYLNSLVGAGLLYSRKWNCLLIDEGQNYTKCITKQCRAIGSICANSRWLLSGTPIREGRPEHILGYFLLLDSHNTPRSIPDMEKELKSYNFRGIGWTMIIRTSNEAFIPPQISHEIISHEMTSQEQVAYQTTQVILKIISDKVKAMKSAGDVGGARKFSSYMMAAITYLRQILCVPMLPITSVAIDMADFNGRSELSKIMLKSVYEQEGMKEWLNDVNSIKSSRIVATLNLLNNHTSDRVIVFACFKSCLDVLENYLPEDRPKFRLTAGMNPNRRGEEIRKFEASENGVFLLSYDLGAEGLNLQCASTVILMDFWWNSSKTKQAIARIVRPGQTATLVKIYYLTSNTGLEKILFEKQHFKMQVVEELMTGRITTKVPKLNIKDIIRFIEMDVNTSLLEKISGRK